MSGFEKKAGEIFEAAQPAASHCCCCCCCCCCLLLRLRRRCKKHGCMRFPFAHGHQPQNILELCFLYLSCLFSFPNRTKDPKPLCRCHKKQRRKVKVFTAPLPNVPFPYNLNRKTVIKVKTPSNQQPFLLALMKLERSAASKHPQSTST